MSRYDVSTSLQQSEKVIFERQIKVASASDVKLQQAKEELLVRTLDHLFCLEFAKIASLAKY